VSPHAFTVVLVVSAAVLALWIMLRYSRFGPQTLVRAMAHAMVAMLLLRLLLPVGMDAVDASGVPAALYVKVFGVALPVFVYAFLSGGWTTRAAIDLLR
jgi:phosphoglycerol transferase MdoB-like AlkP superfamily enzyme